MKTYPYHTPEGIIELVEKREYNKLEAELLREVAENTDMRQDLHELRAANAELIQRLSEARESHLHASARDVQTIQRQAIMLKRLVRALRDIAWVTETGHRDYWTGDTAFTALTAYEASKLEPAANPIDEAVKRMEEVPVLELNKLHFDAMDYGNFNDIEAVRARLIQAARGEQL